MEPLLGELSENSGTERETSDAASTGSDDRLVAAATLPSAIVGPRYGEIAGRRDGHCVRRYKLRGPVPCVASSQSLLASDTRSVRERIADHGRAHIRRGL